MAGAVGYNLKFWDIEAAVHFKSKHGHQPVLIIDAVDHLAKEEPAFFAKLLKFGKTESQADNLRIVFSSSESSTTRQLLDDSSTLLDAPRESP